MSDSEPRPGSVPDHDDGSPPSPAVIPRWEWRTFDAGEVSTDGRLSALADEIPRDSDELYLITEGCRDAVKVRGGLMDIKRLEQVDAGGLEQWRPILKAPFPLTATDVGTTWAALGLAPPRLASAAYTLEALVHELVDPDPEIVALRVHKRRRQHGSGECTIEITDVATGQEVTRTLAVESEHPDRVEATVRELGLQAQPNVSYVRWLKRVAGLEGPRYAAIDIGTNSVKLYLAERRGDGRWLSVVDRAEITRLGEGLADAGLIQAAPAERTIDAIATMVRDARQAGAIDIAAVGTAGLRSAANRDDFVDDVRRRCGIDVEVISGDEEARLSYAAVVAATGDNPGTIAVFETGGGSSQFTFGHGDTVDDRFSLDVGAARFTERFHLDGAVSAAVVDSAVEAIAAELERLDGRAAPDVLIGIGGSLTNLAAVKHRMADYDPEVVRGTRLDAEEVDRQIELYRTRGPEERRRVVGLQPKRAEVILAGACIVRAVLEKLGCPSLTVSDRGLRHGLLIERFRR